MSDNKIGQNLGPIIPSKQETDLTKKEAPQVAENKVTLDSLNNDQAAVAGRSMVKPVAASAVNDALAELNLDKDLIASVQQSVVEMKKNPDTVKKAVAAGDALFAKDVAPEKALAFEHCFKKEFASSSLPA